MSSDHDDTTSTDRIGRTFDELCLPGRLPSPPGLALLLLGHAREEETPIADLLDLIRSDGALTGRLLRLVNASRSQGSPPATSVHAAAARLHPAAVRGCALGFHMVSLDPGRSCELFDYRRHWLLALATACSAEALARHFQSGDPEEAFTVGLLSRVGELAMATLHAQSYAEVLRECRGKTPAELLAAEARTFRTNHWQVGIDLMLDWGLPEHLLEPVMLLARGSLGDRGEDPRRSRELSLLRMALDMADGIVAEAEGPLDPPDETPAPARVADGALAPARAKAQARWTGLAELCGLETGPREPASLETQRPAPEPKIERPEAKVEEPTRILVIEDEPGERRLISFHLRRAGFEVIQAQDGEAGLCAVIAQAPQIVVTDWMMPGISGLEVCKALRRTEMGRKLYVLLLTSFEHEDRIVEGLEAGANDYLTKPFNPRILLARVRAGERMVSLQRQVDRDQQLDKRRVAQMGQLTRKLRNAALVDSMTGLHNRRFAMTQLEQIWAVTKRTGRPLSVVMVDIDHFKRVNDRHGHQVGDAVLCAVAGQLRAKTRRQDHVCRIGGEEFLMIAVNTDLAGALTGAERLRAAVESAANICPGFEGQVTVSLGVAERTSGMERIDDLILAADQAVYLAKAQGRNCVRAWDPPGTQAASA